VVWAKKIEFRKYRVGIKLEEPELIGISRVINAARVKQNSVIEKNPSYKKPLMWLCLILPRVIKP
jgi:hypothetical protein